MPDLDLSKIHLVLDYSHHLGQQESVELKKEVSWIIVIAQCFFMLFSWPGHSWKIFFNLNETHLIKYRLTK